jgi:hypothetical protein
MWKFKVASINNATHNHPFPTAPRSMPAIASGTPMGMSSVDRPHTRPQAEISAWASGRRPRVAHTNSTTSR